MNPRQPCNQDECVIGAAAIAVQDSVRSTLGSFKGRQAFKKIAPHSIGGKKQRIALGNGQHGSLERGQLGTDYTGAQEQDLLHGSLAGASPH